MESTKDNETSTLPAPAPPPAIPELGRFENWWIEVFGRGKHSASLDEIERVMREATNTEQRRLAFVIRRLSLTSGARFETARRHKKKKRTSLVSIIVLSMYSIFFSMMASFPITNNETKALLSMFSLFMSSFIVAFALYEDSKRYDARSENFLRCATEIQVLRDQAATALALGLATQELIKNTEAEYHRILTDYTDNHGNLDYVSHQVSLGKLVGPRRFWFKWVYWLNIWSMPIIALLSPAILYLMYILLGKFT